METVSYFNVDYAPGQYFKCEKQRCTLSVSGCASQYKKAKGGTSLCSGCEIGAAHAGEVLIYGLPVKMCCRCGGTDKRLIHARTCVSCYNREREYMLGRNAKGKPPIHARAVRMKDLLVENLGMLKIMAASSAETMALAFRKNPLAHVRPMWHPAPVVSGLQGRLF